MSPLQTATQRYFVEPLKKVDYKLFQDNKEWLVRLP